MTSEASFTPTVILSSRHHHHRACPKLLKTILVAVAVLVLTYLKIGGGLYQYQIQIPGEGLLDRPVELVLESTNATANAGIPIKQTMLQKSWPPSAKRNSILKFYIISVPETTAHLLNDTVKASTYYRKALNEESAEIWLHRGFERLPQRTMDPREADLFVVAGYLHLYQGLHGRKHVHNKNAIAREWQQVVPLYQNQIIDPTKPHLLLIPTWNPQVSRSIGVHGMVKMLQQQLQQVQQIWSVGFERNPQWQHLPPSRIVPIPYVVSLSSNDTFVERPRIDHSIFYVGDARKNAQSWAGCHREDLVNAIHRQWRPKPPTANNNNQTDNQTTSSSDLWHVQLLGKRERLEQSIYNTRMETSDWCLVLCGDTPTSRTLTSAMIFGCIPLRVGSRLRGMCEEPCHPGFGWTVTGPDYPHLPYGERIDWKAFPEINEAQLLNSSMQDDFLIQVLERYDLGQKERLRTIMKQVRNGWIYGWGDPITSTRFGDAPMDIWESWVAALPKN